MRSCRSKLLWQPGMSVLSGGCLSKDTPQRSVTPTGGRSFTFLQRKEKRDVFASFWSMEVRPFWIYLSVIASVRQSECVDMNRATDPAGAPGTNNDETPWRSLLVRCNFNQTNGAFKVGLTCQRESVVWLFHTKVILQSNWACFREHDGTYRG